jgi:hypothetical protein
MRVTGHARGNVIWPLHEVIEHMRSNPRELRALGKALKPNAHELANRLLRVAANSQPIPPNLASEVALLLLALPGSRPGRPPKESTLELQQLFAEVGTKLGAAHAVSAKTGEPIQNLRRRLRPKTKPKKKGGT